LSGISVHLRRFFLQRGAVFSGLDSHQFAGGAPWFTICAEFLLAEDTLRDAILKYRLTHIDLTMICLLCHDYDRPAVLSAVSRLLKAAFKFPSDPGRSASLTGFPSRFDTAEHRAGLAKLHEDDYRELALHVQQWVLTVGMTLKRAKNLEREPASDELLLLSSLLRASSMWHDHVLHDICDMLLQGHESRSRSHTVGTESRLSSAGSTLSYDRFVVPDVFWIALFGFMAHPIRAFDVIKTQFCPAIASYAIK